MTEKFDSMALAQQDENDERPGVQPVTRDTIFDRVYTTGDPGDELPLHPSAHHFAEYASLMWHDAATDSDGTITNGEVLNRLLADWRGDV
jgi:hypothetical protein